jgi:hypothetical protein
MNKINDYLHQQYHKKNAKWPWSEMSVVQVKGDQYRVHVVAAIFVFTKTIIVTCCINSNT